MNFLILSDFSKIFLNLFKLVFYFKKIKKLFLYRELTWCKVATWRHMYMPRGDACVRNRARVHTCVCTCE